jgi:ferric-dicitrate binding protein FerR (iron transport regulator)
MLLKSDETKKKPFKMTKESFLKYLNGNCTEKEFEQFLTWIREESLTDSGKRMVQEVWDQFEPEDVPVERIKYNRLLDKIHHQININQHSNQPVIRRLPDRNRILYIITRAAAILLLPVLSLLIYTIHSDKKYSGNINDLEVEAPAGFRMNIELGDGTRVWLNHGSKLRYPYRFTGKDRKVFLTGEAYFKVAHNNRIPFIVETNSVEVKATGTTFNVSAYPGENIVETTLVEGKVILYDKTRNHEIKALSPSECLKFNSEKNKYILESGDIIEKYIAWKDGMLVFKNDSIAEIARKLEQWYNVEVKITNEKVKEFTCTATFYDETLSQVLDLMSLPSPVSYKLTPLKRLADGSFSKQSVIIALKK